MHERVVHRALRDLDLDPDQRREIERILDETEPKLHRLAEELRGTMDSTLTEQHDRIKAVLTREQSAEFERRLEEMRLRFEHMRGGRRPHRADPRGEFPPPDHE
jgi:Spy/CpxP family protein refolding chaperone